MSLDKNLDLDSEKEQNLISIKKEPKINDESDDYSKKRHEKIQSFEIANEIDFDKQFPYKDREQTIQYEHKQRFSGDKKDKSQSIVIEENISANPDSRESLAKTKDKNLASKKKPFKFYFEDIIPLNQLKLITMIIMISYIVIGIMCITFFVVKRDEKPFLFCFNFIKRDVEKKQETIEGHEIFFLSDINSFSTIHIILLGCFIKVLITFFLKKENDIKHFFKYFSIFFDLTLIVNIPVFIIGITSNYDGNQYWKVVFYIILTGLGTIFCFIVYIKSKSVKFKNISRLINEWVLSGFFACFELYSLIYNVCILITWGADINNLNLEMIPGSIFFIVSFFYTVFNRDIIFSIASLIIQIGLLYIKRKETSAFTLCIFNVSVVIFNFASIILTIFKHNKEVFRFVEDEAKNYKKQ